MHLDDLTSFELAKILKEDKNKVVILPIGAVEEHGEHLPLSTDSIQPEFIAEQIATKLDALIAPAIRYGICDTTKNFTGTISLSFETFLALISEILEELYRHGVRNIVVLSGHAGRVHMAALRVAGVRVVEKHPKLKLLILSDYDIIYKYQGNEFPAWDGHAGSVETSRVMAIRPDLVKGEGKTFKANFPEYRILPDPERFFPSGVMGDPTAASPEKGEKWNRLVEKELIDIITNLIKDEDR